MKRNETTFYETPTIEVMMLQPDTPVLQSSSAGAFTQDLYEEDFNWMKINK
ncbi:MAG: hypothetical protein ACI4TU_09760 [Candidatus Cryptobacteroides sp.]